MPNIPFPRGVRDLMPNEALFRNELLKKAESVFQRFGFLAIDTPAFESLKVLHAKNGIGEDVKLLYEMKYEDIGLRYDHTVSLARYFGMHQDLPLPFKRYYIGKVWRREEPQKLRYREFTQADIDIVGGRTASSDAEVIAVQALVFEVFAINYRVLVNNRKFVDAMLASFGIKEEMFMPIMRAIDKLDKVGRDGVLELLQKLALDRDTISRIDAFINMEGNDEDKIAAMEKIMADKTVCQETREALALLRLYGLKGQVQIDFSLVRGFDYYTGMIFEFKTVGGETKSSIGGGGRYDNLIGMFSTKRIPAVGSSIGIDRLLDILNYSASTKSTYADVFVANIKDSNYQYALKVGNMFRSNGVATDVNLASRNISNQLAYANALKFKYVVIVGDEEERTGKVKVRNLIDGTESAFAPEAAIKMIKDTL